MERKSVGKKIEKGCLEGRRRVGVGKERWRIIERGWGKRRG